MVLSQLPPGSPDCSLIYSEQQVNKAIQAVAAQITTVLGNSKPLVISIMNGGLYLTGKLMPLLNFPLQLDYLDATRYGDQLTGNQLQWHAYPRSKLEGRTVLLVDDIYDRGFTLEAVYNFCKQQGVADVYSAVLLKKQFKAVPEDGCSSYRPDFTGLVCEDVFVIGCGMDYQGFGRNISGIYAIREQAAQ